MEDPLRVQVGRRSSRLAKSGSDEPSATTPSLVPVKRESTSHHETHPPAATRPDKVHVPIDKAEFKASARDLEVSDNVDNSKTTESNKENIIPSENKFDRIKKRSNEVTKRVSSSNSAAVFSRPSPPREPWKQKTTTKDISVSLLTQLAPLQTQAVRAEVIDFSTPTPAPAGPDFIYQGTSPRGAPHQNFDSSASAATTATLASTDSTWKRKADPECDERPSSKRSSATSVEREQEGLGLTTTRSRTSIELSGYNVAIPGPTHLLDDLSRKLEEPSSTLLGSEGLDTSLTPSTSADRTDEDSVFVQKVKDTLLKQSKRKTNNVGKRQARCILQLLNLAKPPIDRTEALFVTGEEAKGYLEPNILYPGPIFTSCQQSLPLQTICEFLNEQYDDDAQVWIQDPDHKLSSAEPSVRTITIGKLKEQFEKGRVPTPYNCLELAAHVEDGLRPAFLNTEDCRLLTKLKHPGAADQASRRGYTPGWKEVEKWALLAKAGALTEPHQDSHGYGTYITVNQGTIGFGWLSNPSDSQRKAWRADPANFTQGEWRYAVLRPGHTVYFPSGMVHFVFRSPSAGDTLAFGGHVLRCSQIAGWARCLLEERESESEVTNEELSVSAPEYLERVERFVRQAKGRMEEWKWGGKEAIEEFLELKEQFLKCHGVDGGVGTAPNSGAAGVEVENCKAEVG